MRINLFDSRGKETIINVNENDTILKIKQMYGNINGNANVQLLVLQYDGERLRDNKTISDYGIKEDDTISVVEKLFGGGMDTVDISKNITKECEPAKSGPSYREGCNGLSIRSICKNKNCVPYNDTIYVKIGYVQNWNLNDHLKDRVLCPSCKKMVKPKNYYFKKCHYKIDYIKEIDDEYENGTIEDNASIENYKYFDEKESGNAIFVQLIFTVRES